MIAMLRGSLYEKTHTHVILDVGGVGYEVLIPLSTYDKLPAVGQECLLLVSHIVREDDELLFGFASGAEKSLFDLLLSVRGIGPKLGLSVLSGLTDIEFKRCIAEGDTKRLSTVPGIGKKTAERMIVELRDKIDPVEAMSLRDHSGSGDTVMRDTMLALEQLGYARDAARKMLQAAVESGADTGNPETLLKRALSGR